LNWLCHGRDTVPERSSASSGTDVEDAVHYTIVGPTVVIIVVILAGSALWFVGNWQLGGGAPMATSRNMRAAWHRVILRPESRSRVHTRAFSVRTPIHKLEPWCVLDNHITFFTVFLEWDLGHCSDAVRRLEHGAWELGYLS